MKWPKHHEECLRCLRVAFCRPVPICAGSLDVFDVPLCLGCRLGWRDNASAMLASTAIHSRRMEPRQ